jgi:hypothetical protein
MKTTIRKANSFIPLVAVLLLSLSASVFADPIYYFSTGQSGAQTQIDTNHFSSWIVTPTNDITINGGIFTMKDGPKTIEPITFSLYLGSLSPTEIAAGTNSPFSFITLSNMEFSAQVPQPQQYDWHPFDVVSITLTNGITYTASLTSAAPDNQSEAYFIKGNDVGVFITDPIPEPSTYALFGLGALVMVVAYRRKVA